MPAMGPKAPVGMIGAGCPWPSPRPPPVNIAFAMSLPAMLRVGAAQARCADAAGGIHDDSIPGVRGAPLA